MRHGYQRKIPMKSYIRIRSTHEPGKIIALPSRETSWKYIVESLSFPHKKLKLFRDEIRKLRFEEVRNLKRIIQASYEIKQLCDHGNKEGLCLVCELRKAY